MRIVRMRYSNDCSIAATACALRLPYPKVLRIGKSEGFRPNGRNGMILHDLFWALDRKFKVRARYSHRPVYENGEFVRFARNLRPPRIPMRQPFVASVPSVNNRGGFHAIVVERGRVMDPSRKKRVSFSLFLRTRQTMYYDFRHVPPVIRKWRVVSA